MPFCSKCGKQITDDDRFCPGCGTPNRTASSETISANQTIIENNPGQYGLNVGELKKGFEIEGRYRIEEKIGKGGFGTVYKAWDINVETWKALKVIDNIFYDDKMVIANLRKEAKLLMSLNTEHVVRIWDVHLNGDIKFIDMEYIDGGDLVDLMLSYPDRKVPEDRLIPILKQICEGMIKIHDHNIIHKDLKPQNIMLTKEGTVKIMDFGISETFRTSMSRLKESKKSGTPAYMSPEQLLGKDVGKESDVWSFGVMTYELVTGKQMFTGTSSNEVFMQIKERDLDIQEVNNSKIRVIIQKSIIKDFNERNGSFERIANFLTRSVNNTSSNNHTNPKPIEKASSKESVKTERTHVKVFAAISILVNLFYLFAYIGLAMDGEEFIVPLLLNGIGLVIVMILKIRKHIKSIQLFKTILFASMLYFISSIWFFVLSEEMPIVMLSVILFIIDIVIIQIYEKRSMSKK